MATSGTDAPPAALRVAAIGDLHVQESDTAPYRELFTEVSAVADVLVLCGDLTNFGKTGEAEILAEDIRACTVPVLGVLGNHDYECGQPDKVCEILHQAGMTVLDEQAVEIGGVGLAGVKGFLGGFGRGELAPVGGPIVKAVVHGHAHHGTYEGRTPGGRPVFNVAQFVLQPLFGKPFVVLEI
jgi:Icc-related predicted phosphoesterase